MVIFGEFSIGGMPGWRTPSTFSRALNSACVTMVVSAVTSERSSTVTAFLPLSAATTSASGNGCSSLTEIDPDLLALAAQIGRDRLDVVGDRAEADHDGLGVVAHVGLDRTVFAPGQRAVFLHHLAGDARNLAGEMRAMVDGAGLEVRLVLHAAGQTGVVHVDQRRNELARALLMGVDPLPAPLAAQFIGNPRERLFDQRAFAVVFDCVCGLGRERL